MSILNELCPDNATCTFPKCGENCSNNELISPSPTHAAEPSNVIVLVQKQICLEKRKHQIQNYLNLRKSENMAEQICIGNKKYQIQNYLNLRKSEKMVKFRKFNPLGFTK